IPAPPVWENAVVPVWKSTDPRPCGRAVDRRHAAPTRAAGLTQGPHRVAFTPTNTGAVFEVFGQTAGPLTNRFGVAGLAHRHRHSAVFSRHQAGPVQPVHET